MILWKFYAILIQGPFLTTMDELIVKTAFSIIWHPFNVFIIKLDQMQKANEYIQYWSVLSRDDIFISMEKN